MEYYERVKALREDNDLKQTTIAKLLGTEQSYYSIIALLLNVLCSSGDNIKQSA